MSIAKKLKRWLTGDHWEVRRTIWPFKDGYGTYHPASKTILDTGLTREQAQAACDQLNDEREGVKK